MQLINKTADFLNSLLWGPLMIGFIFLTGVYFTVRCGFFQFKNFGFILKNTLGSLFKKSEKGEGVSPFMALSTALSGSVGIGNIVGVTTAISLGGPGAVFWMWFSALFGMMTKYSEIVLAMKFREKNSLGQYEGGPVYYLKKGLNFKSLAFFYAIMGLFVSLGMGNLVQSNAMATAVNKSFNIPRIIPGIIAAVLIFIIMSGGVKRIMSLTVVIIPFLSIFYMLFSIIIILHYINRLPEVLLEILINAFDFKAIAGGGFGSAVRYGFSRGIFSNEAGLGTSSVSHCTSYVKDPAKQGLWGIIEVFIDTIVLCSFTAVVVLITGSEHSSKNGVNIAINAYKSVLGISGEYFLTISLILFAFSTILAWSFYGQSYFKYIFGVKRQWFYKFLFSLFIITGSVFGSDLVWKICDVFNGFVIIPNLLGLLFLSNHVIKATKDFKRRNRLN